MYSKIFSPILIFIVFFSISANAESSNESDFLKKRRGLVTSSQCPFNCKNLNLSAELCREWSSGDKCFVEDFTQVPGHRSMITIPTSSFRGSAPVRARLKNAKRRGLITSAKCPYSCEIAGLEGDLCKDWSDGGKCYVEDFTQVPGHRSMIMVPR